MLNGLYGIFIVYVCESLCNSIDCYGPNNISDMVALFKWLGLTHMCARVGVSESARKLDTTQLVVRTERIIPSSASCRPVSPLGKWEHALCKGRNVLTHCHPWLDFARETNNKHTDITRHSSLTMVIRRRVRSACNRTRCYACQCQAEKGVPLG